MIYRYTKFSNSYLKHMDQSYRQQTHNNFYNSLIEIYDNHSLHQEEHHNQIPPILAVIAVHNNDMDKVDEILEKFGVSPFTTVLTPWANWVMEQLQIEMPKPLSPINIQDIETKLIE